MTGLSLGVHSDSIDQQVFFVDQNSKNSFKFDLLKKEDMKRETGLARTVDQVGQAQMLSKKQDSVGCHSWQQVAKLAIKTMKGSDQAG